MKELAIPMAISVGDKEKYWGGPTGVTDPFWGSAFVPHHYAGKHCKDTENTNWPIHFPFFFFSIFYNGCLIVASKTILIFGVSFLSVSQTIVPFAFGFRVVLHLRKGLANN